MGVCVWGGVFEVLPGEAEGWSFIQGVYVVSMRWTLSGGGEREGTVWCRWLG